IGEGGAGGSIGEGGAGGSTGEGGSIGEGGAGGSTGEGGGPVVGGDTCAAALPLQIGTNQGTWAGAVNDYDPEGDDGESCTDGYPAAGPDVAYTIDLLAGQTLSVTLADGSSDESIYIVTDCADPVGTCVAGEDNGGAETAVYTATDDITVFVIADQYGTGSNIPFTLDAIVATAPDGWTCS